MGFRSNPHISCMLKHVCPRPPQQQDFKKFKNKAARIVSNSSADQPSVEILKLPVKAQVMFKILVTAFRVVQGNAPIYLGKFRDITD